MANGGFYYAEESVTYNAANYNTVRDWAYAVHVARCKAFARSTQKGADTYYGGFWNTDYTVSDLEEYIPYDPDDPDSYMLVINIQDLHKSDVDPTGQYPAFVTIFENGRTLTHYAIITSNGFTNNLAYTSDPTKGLYIPSSKFGGDGYYKFIPFDLAHAFAANGFANPSNIQTGDIGNGELPITTICGLNCSQTGSSTYTGNASNSIVYNPTEGITYTFGYAVKDLAIECFYKTSESAAGMMWSIIGNIFTGDLGYDDESMLFSKFPFGYYAPWRNSFNEKNGLTASEYSYLASNSRIECDVLRDDGWSYRYKSHGLSVPSIASMMPSYMPFRSSSSSPQRLKWASGCVGFSFDPGYNYVRSFDGIDGLGNNTKGFIRDDLLRVVSIFATRIGGATYQGSNFVAMNMGTPQNYQDFGILLGWDPSNPSII